MSEHDLMLKMQNYLPVETQDLLAELTAERALKQRQFDAVLVERNGLRLQVAALAAERDFVQGQLTAARATSEMWWQAYIAVTTVADDPIIFEVSAVTDDGAEEES